MNRVIKRNKRLWIVGAGGVADYTPPDFVHVKCRQDLEDLAAEIDRIGFLEAVGAFEFKHQRR